MTNISITAEFENDFEKRLRNNNLLDERLEGSLYTVYYIHVQLQMNSVYFRSEFISIGIGKTIVEFFSAEIAVSV